MEIEEVKDKLAVIIRDKLHYEILDYNINLFDKFAAYDLLYIVDPLEDTFDIDVDFIITNSDHNIMTINNLAHKILEYSNAKGSNN